MIRVSKDDFNVIAYKLLSYLYECLKAGVPASLSKAEELCGVNRMYFNAVMSDLESRNMIILNALREAGGEPVAINEFRITIDGAEFLSENDSMKKVASAIGSAFSEIVNAAIAVASLI